MQLLDHLFIVKSLESLGDHTLKAGLLPVEDHPIYQAHFPNNPVTPGVCLLQVVVELVRRAFGEEWQLCAVANAKYLAPLVPHEGRIVEYEVRLDPVGLTAHALVTDPERIYAKFSLVMGRPSAANSQKGTSHD